MPRGTQLIEIGRITVILGAPLCYNNVGEGSRRFLVNSGVTIMNKGGIMIRFQRSAQTRKLMPEAVPWAKQVAEYINSKYTEGKLEVFTQRFGPVSTMYWIADFKDLAALDSWQSKIIADGDYWKTIANAFDVLIEATIVDTVMTAV
jgi:hypothetical protein